MDDKPMTVNILWQEERLQIEDELKMLQSAEETLQSTVGQLQTAQNLIQQEADAMRQQLVQEQEARTTLQQQVIVRFISDFQLVTRRIRKLNL